MRLPLQTFVELGLRESPPDLRALGERVLVSEDWSQLPLEAQAVGLVLAKPEESEPWLLDLARLEPVRALALALHASQLTLRFALIAGKLARVLDRPVQKPAAHLPAPLFWLALRRALDATPLLRAEARARVAASRVGDLRLRAALSFLFPEDASLWTEADHEAGLAVEDGVEASFILFAVLRALPSVANATTWPPPAKLLKGLTDAQLEDVSILVRDEKLLAQKRRRAEAKRAAVDVRPLLEHLSEPDALETLALIVPTSALLEQVLGQELPRLDAAERVLLASFVHGWMRELQPSGPPRDAPWRSPWVERPSKKLASTPPAGPVAPMGEWERTWTSPKRVPAESRVAWQALQSVDAVDPFDVTLLVPLGPVILPKLRGWARREPALLAATPEIDDGGLDEALVLAWTARRRQLALAAREFARRQPARANAAALRLCFSAAAKERAVGAAALRALERGASRELAALSAEQRAWVDQLLDARPELPAKKPVLPDFVRLAALPPVLTRDGEHALDEQSVRELLSVMKATPAEDGTPLLSCAGAYSPESLAEFAGCVFRQWLTAGAPPKEKWALTGLAHFPSDAWAMVLGAFCQQWAQGGFPARAQDAVAVLGRMGNRVALSEVQRLATRIRTVGLRSRARLAFEEAASRLGLTMPELEDRLFPEVLVPPGAELELDDSLKPVLVRLGKKLSMPEPLRPAVKALKSALSRLERLMSEGPPLSAVHFTETWGMHPLLKLVAARVVWGIFRREQRVGLFVPTSPLQGDVLALDDDLGVRPVHPIELSADEHARASAWNFGPPAFEQLRRVCYPAAELKGRLQALMDREVFSVALLALERAGWERGPVDGDGFSVDLTRRGDAWSCMLQLDPGLLAGAPTAIDLQHVVGVELESARPLSARVASELQRDLMLSLFRS